MNQIIMNEIVIEVSGGVVVSVFSKEEIKVIVRDFDDIQAGDDDQLYGVDIKTEYPFDVY